MAVTGKLIIRNNINKSENILFKYSKMIYLTLVLCFFLQGVADEGKEIVNINTHLL